MSEIVLRPWQKQDAQPLAAIANNRRIWNNVRDRLPSPYTVVDALQWIAHVSKEDPMVHFAIDYRGQLAGSIGCMLKEDISRKSVEIGYLVGEPFWGKGIATEAVRLILGFIETRLDMVRVFAHVFAHNAASMQVLRKNGFYLESIQRRAVIKNNQVLDDYIWVKLLEKA
ncbi:GNAT family N-acetyltransferase [Sediminibacterium soli]|uniref:GNAT family N-acetyltransferase n=1 Tax=Sediminibacterium soli TaxID=2698829 RepID=UPI00137B5FDF|nr:GNAT family N-acetyltransferase [Sediminibacterium soli]NCI47868.1 GNAT family N-acetyltransferase [Sediminibacterium soli]